MNNLLKCAMQIAENAHANQIDKAGQPYINHPIAVANKLNGEIEKIVALLHDVVEDSATTLEDIRKAGFDEYVVKALDCITKRKGEAYDDYLLRVKNNDIAKMVKLADLSHNMDMSRLPSLTDKDLERLKKYEYAVSVLS